MSKLNLNEKESRILSLIFLILSIISLLIQSITFLLSKLIFIQAEPNIVYAALLDKWLDSLPSLTKLATFSPGIIAIILLILSVYMFVKDKINK
ncbi:MAG: hypothetical protein KIC98_09620 [Clostridioides difficile]|nr:hypothetical protein [Clostridioides sp.]MBS5788154.1 hypothetical protein [Clostridioides difficile]